MAACKAPFYAVFWHWLGFESLHKNCEAQGDPDDFRTNDGRGACNGGVGEGFKPECKMQGQENTADRTETDGFTVCLPELGKITFFSEHHRCHQKHRPQQAVSCGH